MKRCTWCGKEYPDTAGVCLLDQQPLETIALPSRAEKEEFHSTKTWARSVLFPALGWLLLNCVLTGLVGLSGPVLLAWVMASFAAIDCSRFQLRGSRVLGIAFKPVVVFAVVAFFLWGFGFVWYLTMRHRVITAAIPPEMEEEAA